MSEPNNPPDPLQAAENLSPITQKIDIGSALTMEQSQQLIHDFQTHQIELEMQNEALRQAQLALEKSQARFQYLYDHSPVGYCTLNPAGLITEANLMMATLLGMTRNKLTKQPFSRFISDLDQDRFYLLLKRLDETGQTQTEDIRILHKDGQQLWLQVVASIEQSADESSHKQLIVNNITERKLAEIALRESEYRWKFALEGAGDGLWDWDVPAGKVFFSLTWKNMLGYSEHEISDDLSEWASRVHPDDKAQVMADVQAHLDGKTPNYINTHRVRCKDGRYKWILDRGMVVGRNAKGKPLRMIGTHTDVTERTHAKEQLLLSEQKLITTLQSMGDAVIVTGTTGLITRMNPTAENLTGWSFTEAVGRPLIDIFHTHPTLTDQQMQAETGPYTKRTILWSRNGTEYTIAQNVAPILDAKGLISGVVRVFRDVSAEERVQEKLARATELLERTGELAKIGGWEVDLSTMKLSWTRETFRIAEIDPPNEPALEQGINLFAPEARPIITAALQHTIETGTPYDLELPLISFKGRHLWVRTQGFAVMENGKAVKLRGTFQDISESRETQLALKTSEARFRSIFNASLVPFALNDEQFNITALNPAFIETFGYTHEDIPTLADWFPKAYPDENYRRQAIDSWQAELQRSQQTGEVFKPIELRICCKDGRYKTVLISATALSDDFKGIHLVMLYDITARKHAEEELQANRGQLANMIDTAMDAIISTNTDFKIVLFNRAAEQLFGYSADTMLGQSINVLIPLKLAEGHGTLMRQFAQHGESTRKMGGKSARQVSGLRADGSEFPVEVSISYSDNYGNPIFTAMVRDITERIEHENALLQLATTLEIRVAERTHELEEAKQLAEQANRAKSTFLANMSHEIRTPLNSVLGMAYLAQQQATDPKQRDYLHKITLSGNHLLGLINDILDFSKIGAGRFELDQVDFDLIEMLSVLRKMLQQKINEKNLELRVSIEKSLPPLRHGDDLRIKQVLLNILSNAIKFTERGSITLEVGLDPDLAEFEQHIRFVIRDTGIGISDAAQTTLFDSFQQADNTTTRKYGGTGLGLAISRQLVQLMGGELKLTSRLGHGSEFRFSIPLPPAQAIKRTGSDAQITVSNPDQFKNKHILLADDHPFNQQITTELLQAIGAKVTIANNGIEVIELARSTHFDAILMDVQMPEMDGITACQVLLHDNNWQQIPIIAMTANASTEDRQRCLKAGMVDFISKPIQPEKLYRILSQWLYRDQPAPPEGFSSAAETTNDATQTAFIDTAFMHSMLGDDPMRQRRYFAKFAQSMQEGLDTLQAHCIDSGDPVIGQECHRLKSVARTVGALPLGELLDEIEQQQLSLSPEQLQARLQATQQLFNATCDYLNQQGLLLKLAPQDKKETP